ncbi:MAG: hypothetical protein LBP63_07865 [Prevotellaceae bacterium]|jgi:DNA polymerase sigma|nr:hypothetical protein [Prevotellaceae bacterium]
MKNLNFNAQMTTADKQLNVSLELYIFSENDLYLIYCPSIDLSAAGKSIEDAQKEFAEVFRLHVEYCLNKKTLLEDLKQHGWIVKRETAQAPSVEQMLNNNDTLKNIIFHKNYQKITHSTTIPAYA